jgi:hypothetical protein
MLRLRRVAIGRATERGIGLLRIAVHPETLEDTARADVDRRVHQLRWERWRTVEHWPCVGDFAEALYPVIAAEARIADPAEGYGGVDHMPAPVVDRYPARACLANYAIAHGGLLAEQIQRQRMRMVGDIGDGVVQRAVADDRQDRPEYFLLSDLHVGGYAGDDMQRNAVVAAPTGRRG